MLDKIFIWWEGATLGALFDIKRRSRLVGSDEFGNRYFEDRKASTEGRKRRYVIYKGLAEPSKVPPDWHGWLHHRVDIAPSQESYKAWEWEQPHQANMTGSPMAYRPKGSILTAAQRPSVTGDYDAWSPE